MKKTEQKKTKSESKKAPQTFQLNFCSYIYSIASSVLIFLGEGVDPTTKKKKVDLDMAKYHIDLLSILEEKTKGNLNSEEQQLIQNVLLDLRFRFAEKLK